MYTKCIHDSTLCNRFPYNIFSWNETMYIKKNIVDNGIHKNIFSNIHLKVYYLPSTLLDTSILYLKFRL